MIILNKIAERRKRLNLTQKELAEKTGTNVRWIQKLEKGEIDINNITFINAVKLLKAFADCSDDNTDKDDFLIIKEAYCLLKGLLNI